MESTQERIVTAARKLFGEGGFHRTTTAEIARAASIAEGTIYRYFKDKRELFLACVEPVVQEAVRREKAVITGDSPGEILRRRIITRMTVMRENLDVFNILFTEGHHFPEIAQLLIGQISGSISPEEWATLARVQSGGRSLPEGKTGGRVGATAGRVGATPNPLIMTVGLTAAIWAMLLVNPQSRELFAGWPGPSSPETLDTDFADFVCSAVLAGPNP